MSKLYRCKEHAMALREAWKMWGVAIFSLLLKIFTLLLKWSHYSQCDHAHLLYNLNSEDLCTFFSVYTKNKSRKSNIKHKSIKIKLKVKFQICWQGHAHKIPFFSSSVGTFTLFKFQSLKNDAFKFLLRNSLPLVRFQSCSRYRQSNPISPIVCGNQFWIVFETHSPHFMNLVTLSLENG